MNKSDNSTTDMLGQALFLMERRGWTIIPVGTDKRPLIEWKKFQTEKPGNEDIFEWFATKFLNANLGVITGKASGIVVVDIDPRHGGNNEKFSDLGTLVAKTGGGGWHYYFQYEEELQNQAGIQPGIDIRGEGGYVVVPPSLHESGNRYEWIGGSETTPILPLPDFVREWMKKGAEGGRSNWSAEKLDGVGEGQRNETAASVIGKWLIRFPEEEWGSDVWPLAKLWNQRNSPPLSGNELRNVFESIMKNETAKRDEMPPQASIHIPNATEFMSQEIGDTNWVIEGLIPISGSAIIVAKRESYKTWLALYISDRLTKGLPLWDKFSTQQTKVLYISNDDPASSFKKRLEQLSFNDLLFVYHDRLPPFSIERDNGGFESAKKLVAGERIGVVIVDTLRNTHNRDSNTDKDAKIVFDKFKELRLSNPGLSIIFVIHPAKENALERRFGGKRQSEEAVGSYYWEAGVDTVLSLTKTVDDLLTDKVTVTITKNKQSEKRLKPFVGICRRDEGPVEFTYEEVVPESLKVHKAKDFIFDCLSEKDYKRQELIDLTVSSGVCAARTVEQALKELHDERQITHSNSKPHIYSLVKAGDDSANRNDIYETRNAESGEERI